MPPAPDIHATGKHRQDRGGKIDLTRVVHRHHGCPQIRAEHRLGSASVGTLDSGGRRHPGASGASTGHRSIRVLGESWAWLGVLSASADAQLR